MPDWLTWLGTPFQGISAAALVTLVGYVLFHFRGMRKLSIEARQVDVNAQQVSGQERADIRDHYAQEVNRYYQQVVGLRDELEKCEKDCATKIKRLEDDLAGERKARVAEQVTLVRVLADALGDSPQLAKFMKAMESVQSTLPHLAPPEERGIEPLK